MDTRNSKWFGSYQKKHGNEKGVLVNTNSTSSRKSPGFGSTGGPKHSESFECQSRFDRKDRAADCLGKPTGSPGGFFYPHTQVGFGCSDVVMTSCTQWAQGPPPPVSPNSTGSLMLRKHKLAICCSTCRQSMKNLKWMNPWILGIWEFWSWDFFSDSK